MTTINVNELRELFNEKALSKAEGERITFSNGAMEQMKGYLEAIIVATGYDETKLDSFDLSVAKDVIGIYSPDAITGEVIDGTIQPLDQNVFNAVIENVPSVSKHFTPPMIMAMKIIAEETEKKGFFYR